MTTGHGESLLRTVEAYAAFGDHRTGGAGDVAATAWFADELVRRGAVVERQPFAFERHVAEWEVRIDGEVVESLPLSYEGTGSFTAAVAEPLVDLHPVRSGSTGTTTFDGLVEAAARATARGREVGVLATPHPLGLLVAPNRLPGAGSGFPVVLVAGREADRLATATVVVDLDAHDESSVAHNVVGRFGTGAVEETVVVTTPLSGWFACAGERGTGLAVAIGLAERLAAHHPVLVLGATGHELGALGAAHLERSVEGRPRAVVHVGANAACTTTFDEAARAPLAARLPVRAAGTEAEERALAGALAPTGWSTVRPEPPSDPAKWVGEAASWAERGTLLVSVVDANPWFHTPQDLPGTVTSSAVLAAVAVALGEGLDAALTRRARTS